MRMSGPHFICRMVMVLVMSLGFGAALPAVELWTRESGGAEDGSGPAAAARFSATLNATAKFSALLANQARDPITNPQRNTALSLFRLRFDLRARYGDSLAAEVAYDHAAAVTSSDRSAASPAVSSGLGGTALNGSAPFRVTPLHDRIVDERRVLYTHELDRLLLAWHPAWGEIVVGRQAIGLGRGVLFSAVDLFAPFAPLAVDREWRPGVDAARVEARLSDTASVEGILVGGTNWAESAGLVRARGYLGKFDAELLAGVRTEEPFAGAVASSAVGDAEIHVEAAMFRLLRPHPDGAPFGDDRLAAKAVVGASYNFNVGDGLTVVAEYLYSGLGAEDSRKIQELLFRPEFQARYRRGELQILSRHALGLQVSYPLDPTATGTVNVVGSPQDGSGVFSPGLRWDPSDGMSVLLSASLPWGRGSKFGNLRSEYGSSPRTLFAQWAWYL